MLGSLALGSISVIATLIKYVHSRHRFVSLQASSSLDSQSRSTSATLAVAKIRVDKVLLLRFSIAFVILR